MEERNSLMGLAVKAKMPGPIPQTRDWLVTSYIYYAGRNP